MSRERRIDTAALAVSIVSIAFSGPIIVAFSGPVLAIALWRNILGAAATIPFAFRQRAQLRALSPKMWWYTFAAGILLGMHFGTWIPSLRYTSIAASTALVATQVVWAALIAFATGHRAPRAEWIGIGIALIGTFVLTGIDISLDPDALFGDLLALAGAVAAAAYVVFGQRVRSVLPLSAYTSVVYVVAALTLLVLCQGTGHPRTLRHERHPVLPAAERHHRHAGGPRGESDAREAAPPYAGGPPAGPFGEASWHFALIRYASPRSKSLFLHQWVLHDVRPSAAVGLAAHMK